MPIFENFKFPEFGGFTLGLPFCFRQKRSYKHKGFTLIAKARGFTLIELTIAISIVAVLATIGAVTYSNIQKNARISKRIQDLNAIKTALETYKTANGRYPIAPNWRSECSAAGHSWIGNLASSQVIPNLVPEYMVEFPSDSAMDKANNKNCYLYISGSDGREYKMMAYYLFDMSNAEIFARREYVDPRYNNPSRAPSGFAVSFCAGAEGSGDNRALSVYSSGGRCF